MGLPGGFNIFTKILDWELYIEILRQVMFYLIVRWVLKFQILAWLELLQETSQTEIQREWWELSKFHWYYLYENLHFQLNFYLKIVMPCSGYMAQEYAFNGLFSTKSNVFSFGILLLEIKSGKKSRGFYHPNNKHNLIGHVSIK